MWVPWHPRAYKLRTEMGYRALNDTPSGLYVKLDFG